MNNKIIVKKDFSLNGTDYFEGDELLNIQLNEIIKLNEKGLIQPLTRKEIETIKRNLNKKGED